MNERGNSLNQHSRSAECDPGSTQEIRLAFEAIGHVQIDLAPLFPTARGFSERLAAVPDACWSQIIKHSAGEADFYADQFAEASVARQLAFADYSAGKFAFAFRRLPDNQVSQEIAVFRDIKIFLEERGFIGFLNQVSGRRVTRLTDFYVSRYERQDFLTTHCDSGPSLGIVINFTRNWNANHGGLTFLLSEDRSRVVHTIVPKDCELFLFDTSQRKVPHFVSMVTANAATKRLAAIARYD